MSKSDEHGTAGRHIVCDMYGVRLDPKLVDDVAFLRDAGKVAAEKSGNKVLNFVWWKFSPQGASVVLLLAESHLSIHTYPEHNYVSVDIYSCGTVADPTLGIDHLISVFKPTRYDSAELSRGVGFKQLETVKWSGFL